MHALFDNKYKIIKSIGSGGMGVVYLVENVTLGTVWAMKAIPKKDSESYDLLAEPNILKKLHHPALPRIVDIDQDENNLYIIEDYIEGEPLDKQMRVKKHFDEATVIEWTKQLCNILNYLHNQKPRPIIYRDMKPSNIIVSSENVVKVIDFGIAREYKSGSGSDTSYMGTRGYAAPEQYGTSQTDARTDIYSLGVTMYHLLTGKSPNEPPYEFRPLRMINPSFSEGIEYIVLKCVQNDPANRYQSANELLHDLNNIHLFNSQYKKQKRALTMKLAAKCAALLLSVVMMFVSGSFVIADREEQYNNFLDEGYHYLSLYDFQAASGCFESAMRMDSGKPEAYYGVAQIYMKQGNYEACLAYLEDIGNQKPAYKEYAHYNYLLGSTYYAMADYQTAAKYLGLAKNAEPDNGIYKRDLAVCYAKLGNFEKANSLLDSIVTDGVTDDVLYYVKGQVKAASGNVSEAIEDFEKVISVTQDDDIKMNAYMELSNIYKDMRHADPNNWSALNNQIDVLERAVRDLNNEDNLILTEAMGEAYFTAKRYDLSVQKFKRLLELGYERAYIYRNIAIIYQQTDSYAEAEEILLVMKEKYPNNYQCYLQLAYLYMDIEGKKPEVQRNYDKVVSNYNLAVQFAPSGMNTSDIMQLTAKMDELRMYGWI